MDKYPSQEDIQKALNIASLHDCSSGFWKIVLFSLNQTKTDRKGKTNMTTFLLAAILVVNILALVRIGETNDYVENFCANYSKRYRNVEDRVYVLEKTMKED